MQTTPSGAHRALALAAAAFATVPAAANTMFIQQNSYSITVDPSSKLTIATGYSGAQATGFSLPGNPPYLLQVGPGQNQAQAASLVATFTADPGWVFTGVDWRMTVPVSTTEGSGYLQMNWTVTGHATVHPGSSPTWTNGSWNFNGTPYLDSPFVALNEGSFQLDILASLRAAGYAGGCSGSSGQCATVGAPWFDVYAYTAAVPEPGAAALWLAGGGVLGMLLRRRGSGASAWASAASGRRVPPPGGPPAGRPASCRRSR